MGRDMGKSIKRLPTAYKEMMGTAPYLQFNSNREVTLDGCKGILEYQSDIIRVSTGSMVIVFKGRQLNIKCLTATAIVVAGYITNVEFIR